MTYVGQQDLVDRFGEGELAQCAPDGNGGIDPVKVLAACEDADGEIDSHLAAGGYATPVSPVPKIILAYAADITRYRLHDDDAPPQVKARYDQAMKFLAAVAKGEVKLSAGAPAPESPVGSAEFIPGRQVFPGGGF